MNLADLRLPPDIETSLAATYSVDDGWLADLTLIAASIDTGQPPSRIPATHPWGLVAEQLTAGISYGEGLPAKERYALSQVVGRALAWRREGDKRQKMTSRLTKAISARVIAPYLESPDEGLKAQISAALSEKDRSALERKQIAESIFTDWLGAHGRFIRTADFLYYMYDDTSRLFDMESTAWQSWLHALTGVNPATLDFKVLLNAGISAARNRSENHTVVKMAHWDAPTKTLRVSRYDGTVYRLDGENVIEEKNGDGPVIFLDGNWTPYEPQENHLDDFLAPFLRPTWDARTAWMAAVWVLSLFFTELCPTKPLAVFLGEKGSGKSLSLRMILKLLYGDLAELSASPEKPDDFLVNAYHAHVLALDNFDGFQEWMRDTLASLATGVEMSFRTLYTNKDITQMKFRTWVAATARQPDTLRRDDLADRLLILKLGRVPDAERERESAFLEDVSAARNFWWGSLFLYLNKIVARLRAAELPKQSPLRMADWEVFGSAASEVFGREDDWQQTVRELKKAQGDFVSDDVIVEAIQKWLENPFNTRREVIARELYSECQTALFGDGKTDSDWPRSVVSFGKRLKNVSEYLKNECGMEVYDYGGRMKYKFSR